MSENSLRVSKDVELQGMAVPHNTFLLINNQKVEQKITELDVEHAQLLLYKFVKDYWDKYYEDKEKDK